MSISRIAAAELSAELTAHRFTCQFLMKALAVTLSATEEPERSLIVEALENQFAARRGEWLYPAGPDIDAELQIAANRAMQEALRGLSLELRDRLKL